MNNSDERDYAEEAANQAEMEEQDHCIQPCDIPPVDAAAGDCVRCPCCCTSGR